MHEIVEFVKGTFLAVVIPSFNERNIVECLNSLGKCNFPGTQVAVIVVVNNSEDASEDIRNVNLTTLRSVDAWRRNNRKDWLNVFPINATDMPAKDAGVGLARRIGMDLAAEKFKEIAVDGIIVCYDADCTCSENYLEGIAARFANPNVCVASLYFEHPISGSLVGSECYEAIIYYETHLRYYVEALRYAKFPFAIHTVGSSMAVRASAYRKSGGMNKRKAGEDFYFLNKVANNGGYIEINNVTVYPSPRVSDRVPFGTGKAIADFLVDRKRYESSYSLKTFKDLQKLFTQVNELYYARNIINFYSSLPLTIRAYVSEEDFVLKVVELRDNSASYSSFLKRFFTWWNAFYILKFVHFSRDEYYPNESIESLVAKLLDEEVKDIETCLKTLRKLQRKGPPFTVGL